MDYFDDDRKKEFGESDSERDNNLKKINYLYNEIKILADKIRKNPQMFIYQ
jgi:hypothetical protein